MQGSGEDIGKNPLIINDAAPSVKPRDPLNSTVGHTIAKLTFNGQNIVVQLNQAIGKNENVTTLNGMTDGGSSIDPQNTFAGANFFHNGVATYIISKEINGVQQPEYYVKFDQETQYVSVHRLSDHGKVAGLENPGKLAEYVTLYVLGKPVIPKSYAPAAPKK
jgi:hypothetical protein